MKRVLLMILVLLLISAPLAGCGGSGSENPFDTRSQDTKAPAGTSDEGTSKQESRTSAADDTTKAPAETSKIPEVTVRPAEWANIEWTDYSNVWFTMKIPKGWEVEWQGDTSQLIWIARIADKTVGISNIDHYYAAKDPSLPSAPLINMYLENGTVREFFEKFYAENTSSFTVENSCVPPNKDQLQAMRPYTPIKDYQALYATFSEPDIPNGEGIYSAVIMDSQDIYIRGVNNASWEINAIFSEWAPAGSLVNWIPVFSQMLNSFKYTDFYIQQWQQDAQTTLETPSLSDSDSVVEAFEERSREDTIIQEKRSDMS